MTDHDPHEQGPPSADEPRLPEELVRALRAPGTPEELAGEQQVLAAFRAARPAASTRLRLVGRVGVGGAAAVTALVLGSGVAAAAFSDSLPDPVQRLAHQVLAPIGVPPAAPRHHRPRLIAEPPRPAATPSGPRPTTTPLPTDTPTNTPSHMPPSRPTSAATAPLPTPSPSASASVPAASTAAPSAASTPSSTAASASASATPTPSATTSPTASASPTTQPTGPPVPAPATLAMSLSDTQVAAGSTVLATGTALDAAGRPVARQRVLLQATTGSGWATMVSGLTDRHGTVALYSRAVTQNTRFRLRLINPALARPLVSAPVRVTEVPDVIVTFTDGLLRVSTVGAQPGDTLRIGVVRSGTVVTIGTVQLIGSGAIVAVPPAAAPPTASTAPSTTASSAPSTTARQRYVVVLPRTSQHLGAKGAVTVPSPGR